MSDNADLVNPYAPPEKRIAYAEIVTNLFQLGALTSGYDITGTMGYIALVGASVTDPADHLGVARSLLWEVANLSYKLTRGNEPTVTQHECDDPTHNHNNPAGGESLTEFAGQAMEAFFLAAAVGRLDDAVKVVDAMRAEAGTHNIDPDAMANGFFAQVLFSLCFTCHKQHNPWRLFGIE